MKILFAWEWGTGSGHLRRFVPLATFLRDAGHQVTIVAKELHQLPRLFPLENYCWVQAPVFASASDFIANPVSFVDVVYNLGLDNDDRVLAVCAAWSDIIKQHRPDLVISDFGVACLWVASAMGLPTVRIGTGYTCPPQGAESTSFIQGVSGPSLMADSILGRVSASIKKLGLGSTSSWNDVFLPPSQTLLASVPTLDPFSQFRTDIEYSGTWDHDGHVQPEWHSQGKYRAVAYLKPFPQLRQLLVSLHSMSIETVLYGDGIPEEVIRPIRNPLLRVSDSPLRLSGISPACDLVICNGNHGTSAKALSQGIPVFAIPLFLEQRVTAARLQREGWGVSADPQRPDLFVPKAIESTHDSTRAAAARYPGLVAQYGNRSLEHAWQKLRAFLR